MYKIHGDGNPDGQMFGQVDDRIGFAGKFPVPIRGFAPQQPVPASVCGELIGYWSTQTPVSGGVAANSTAAETYTVTGLLTTDTVIAVNKPTTQAGLGITGFRISAADTLELTWSNNTAGVLTPTAAQVYQIMVARGLQHTLATLSPAAVAADSIVEQTFDIGGSGATATAVVNVLGQVVEIRVVDGGSGYYHSPAVEISGPSLGPVMGTDANPLSLGGIEGKPLGTSGVGATANAIVNSSGVVIGFEITNPGSGYSQTTPPTVAINGGGYVAPGMVVTVCKPTTQAGLGVGNCRISAPNQIAITFINNHSATLTPTASESYRIFAAHAMPNVAPIALYGVNVPSASVSTATVSILAKQQTVTGLAANDVILGIQKPTNTAGLHPVGGYLSAANTLQIVMCNPTSGALTPSGAEVYTVTAFKMSPPMPMRKYTPFLTPTSVAANVTAEQTFTVTGLPAGSTVWVNKQTYQQGLTIVGCRVSALNTLAITFQNNSAAAIVPTAEVYLVASFEAPMSGADGFVSLPVSQTLNRVVDGMNELRHVLDENGLERGY